MKKVILSLFGAAIGFFQVFAQQTTTATLSGRVADPSGAVIVGAKVIATRKSTGAKRETMTNSEGVYALTNLSPGEYEVKIEARNFPQALVRRIELNVGQQAVFRAAVVRRNLQLPVHHRAVRRRAWVCVDGRGL